jgi:hypothetical protein
MWSNTKFVQMFNVLSKHSTIQQMPNKDFIAMLIITLSYEQQLLQYYTATSPTRASDYQATMHRILKNFGGRK